MESKILAAMNTASFYLEGAIKAETAYMRYGEILMCVQLLRDLEHKEIVTDKWLNGYLEETQKQLFAVLDKCKKIEGVY